MKRSLLLCFALLLAGCGPWISPITAPPASGVAEFDWDKALIRVSEGVAYAFECSDNGPCNSLATEVANPQVAIAYIGHLTVPQYWGNGMRNVTAFVVVGQHAGRTEMVVRNGSSTKKYVVEVLPAIQVSTTATSAAQPTVRLASPIGPSPVAPQSPSPAPSGAAPAAPTGSAAPNVKP